MIKTEKSDKIIGVIVKEEVSKARIKDEEEQEELRKIEARNRKTGANRKWPTDAQLVHIDGTECSEHCMHTSAYHKDPDEISTQELETSPVDNIDNTAELDAATSNKHTLNTSNDKNFEQETSVPSGCAKECNSEKTDKDDSNQTARISLDDSCLEVQKVKKKYNITRAKGLSKLHDDTLPDIETTTTNDWGLPEAVPVATLSNQIDPTLNQLNEITRDIVSIEDNLPSLEQPNYLEDMEALMSLENDYNNSELVPIGEPPAVDVVKDLNEALGINGDLEIAMDNALFIENTTCKSVATVSTENNKTNSASTPGSLKGVFRTKTHGIRRLTPEEKQDKLFRCEACEFMAYSRRSISDHFQDTHGKVQCDICQGFFANPHALKRV